jgi:hypothetical protein
MKKLSDKQEDMLYKLWDGDVPINTFDGYFWEYEPCVRFDRRTANSLLRRNLIYFNSVGVGVGMMQLDLHLTNEGEYYVEEHISDRDGE